MKEALNHRKVKMNRSDWEENLMFNMREREEGTWRDPVTVAICYELRLMNKNKDEVYPNPN